jgi:hypothetical protein
LSDPVQNSSVKEFPASQHLHAAISKTAFNHNKYKHIVLNIAD